VFPSLSFLLRSGKINKSNESSKELYREAAHLLAMSCEFTENCRCLDCQVRQHNVRNYTTKLLYFLLILNRVDTLTVTTTTTMMMIHFRITLLKLNILRRAGRHLERMEKLYFTVMVMRDIVATMLLHTKTV
jgi:hypothetical protein